MRFEEETRERDVREYLVRKLKKKGKELRKVRWIGRRGAPDERVLGVAWVELKAPGQKPQEHQAREHERMRLCGERVEIIDCYEAVDRFVESW